MMAHPKAPPLLLTVLFAGAMWLLSWLPPVLPIAIRLGLEVKAILAAILAIPGVMLVVLGVAAFRTSKTTVNPTKPETASTLVTSGIYRVTRNPMYLGFLLLLLSWAVLLASLYAWLLPAVFVWYLNMFQIAAEEAALEKIFGKEFMIYKRRVRRWL